LIPTAICPPDTDRACVIEHHESPVSIAHLRECSKDKILRSIKGLTLVALDAADLVRPGGESKIADWRWTVEKTGCPTVPSASAKQTIGRCCYGPAALCAGDY